MTWKGRTLALGWALLLVLSAIVMLMTWGARPTPVIPVGQAEVEQLIRAVEEMRRNTDRTEADVRKFIRDICRNYPELQDAEACRDSDTSH